MQTMKGSNSQESIVSSSFDGGLHYCVQKCNVRALRFSTINRPLCGPVSTAFQHKIRKTTKRRTSIHTYICLLRQHVYVQAMTLRLFIRSEAAPTKRQALWTGKVKRQYAKARTGDAKTSKRPCIQALQLQTLMANGTKVHKYDEKPLVYDSLAQTSKFHLHANFKGAYKARANSC